MKVLIETIPHGTHRYDTTGDYWWVRDKSDPLITTMLVVKVSEMPDERMSFLVALHEMVEAYLCEQRGIAEPDITAWDKAVPDDSPYADDPGHDPAAPYHKEHVFAECVERLVARELGVNWPEYEAACEALYPR